ncbi:MAG TPA: arsenosugar biosynthesis radical SAM (seleno)protein ArsS [Sedimentisphaerales bacterium]|nr:arsenosugar biosynthesis radical SAM (seleno)protein ArsS [Sedimentisphaerales bacterium]
MAVDFGEAIAGINPALLRFDALQTLQVNLGNRCNQSCAHCHVQAGPNGKKIMPRQVMQQIIDFLRKRPGLCVDMTGGCPELNPNFRFFVDNVCRLARPLMVRTNLTVLLEPGLDWVSTWYRSHKVVVIGSLPCYTEENVDKQRGPNVFSKSIRAIRMLNELRYGRNNGLELDLVYNPGGDFLPSPQEKLEADYKRELHDRYGISFNKLFTITNAPIGRFKRYLQANGLLEQYLKLLMENFNPDAAGNIMCRNLVSVDYRGILYNCDFNQALGLPIIDAKGSTVTIEQLEHVLSSELEIITGEHCFCCTAGAGSSCTGSLVK